MGLGGGGAIACPPEKLDYQPLLLNVFLMQYPYCWSAIPVRTRRVMQLLTSTWQSHVSLKVIKNTRYTHSEESSMNGALESHAASPLLMSSVISFDSPRAHAHSCFPQMPFNSPCQNHHIRS